MCIASLHASGRGSQPDEMICVRPLRPLLIKLRMFRTSTGGTRIDARVRSKGYDHQRDRRPVATSEYILYDANAGYQQTLLPVVTWPAKEAAGGTSQKTGLRSHQHHQHHDPTAAGQSEQHETPDPLRSGAVKPRFHCVRVGVGVGIRVGRLRRRRFRVAVCVRVAVCIRVRVRVRAWGGSALAFALALATASEPVPCQAEHPAAIKQDTPDSKEAWARSGAWPPRAQTGKARYLSALQ
jgi:hypothetical protein